jgi:hypothetical protein
LLPLFGGLSCLPCILKLRRAKRSR